jgi:hypothetical protein
MPDFATPPGGSSPAHAQLAAAFHDPMDGLPVRLVAIAWFADDATPRFVTINATAAFRSQPDPWWGRISRCAVVLVCSEAESSPHTE